MKFTWIFGLFLAFQTTTLPDSLTIEQDREPVAYMNRLDYEMPLHGTPFINLEKYHSFLEMLDKKTYQPPVNAYIDDAGRIVSEQTGSKLHRKAFTELFYTYFYKKGASTIEMPMLTIYPRVEHDLLVQIYKKQIGQYVTYFNRNNQARTHNIILASEAINNHVVFPGETFSFNEVVGKRTKERGYMKAPVIVRGELSEDIGGGICQVSSTLFNAADHAGTKILERYSHSKQVPYVPPGRDATVSWYGPDFAFTNPYSLPLLIRAKAIGGQMIIRIYSSDEIQYEPRSVPSTIKALPPEIPFEKGLELQR